MTRTHLPAPFPSSSTWIKSSYSEGSGNACVEVALLSPAVHIRDSKDIRLPGLALSSAAWTAFIQSFAA